jgi:tRNA G18 (ribose-2'-O)-methylase SpoU
MPGRTEITAASNARFKAWKRLAEGQDRVEETTLVCGRRIVEELACSDPQGMRTWIVPAGYDGVLPGPAVPEVALSPALFREVDVFGTRHPILEMDVRDRVSALPPELPAGLNLALPVQDPVNLGAVVRSAVGLGCRSVVLLPGACNPFHVKAVRTSAGAVFRCRLVRNDPAGAVSWGNCPVVALDASGVPIREFRFPERFVLLVGQEGQGVRPRDVNADHVVSLPMERIESYNAGVAAALAMYEWRRQQ